MVLRDREQVFWQQGAFALLPDLLSFLVRAFTVHPEIEERAGRFHQNKGGEGKDIKGWNGSIHVVSGLFRVWWGIRVSHHSQPWLRWSQLEISGYSSHNCVALSASIILKPWWRGGGGVFFWKFQCRLKISIPIEILNPDLYNYTQTRGLILNLAWTFQSEIGHLKISIETGNLEICHSLVGSGQEVCFGPSRLDGTPADSGWDLDGSRIEPRQGSGWHPQRQ